MRCRVEDRRERFVGPRNDVTERAVSENGKASLP
jgi:hypothetical protein